MSATLHYWAVIPATGVGQRMGADRPKQYLQLASKTILELTLDNLLSYPAISGAVLILNEKDSYWPELDYQHQKPILLATGGEQRHHSVYNGLLTLKKHVKENNPVVLIHDAVRPFVLHKDLDRLLETVRGHEDGGLLAAPVADTLKVADDDQRIRQTTSREGLWRAFTPQAFRLGTILQALDDAISKHAEITDDAAAMELAGYHPLLVEADSLNIKITHPSDLAIAQLLLNRGV